MLEDSSEADTGIVNERLRGWAGVPCVTHLPAASRAVGASPSREAGGSVLLHGVGGGWLSQTEGGGFSGGARQDSSTFYGFGGVLLGEPTLVFFGAEESYPCSLADWDPKNQLF